MNTNTFDNVRTSFFTQMTVNPERVRSILSTGWKLKLLGELTLNREGQWPEEVTTLMSTVRQEWVDEAMNAPQLRPYYRMLNAGYEAYKTNWYPMETFFTRSNDAADNTVDHVLVNNFWGDQLEVLVLSTGERIPTHEVFSTNAEMYQPYAMIRGKRVPIISLMHMGL